MFNEDDGLALRAEFLHDCYHRFYHLGEKSSKRLVKENRRDISSRTTTDHREHAGDLEELALTVGEILCELTPLVPEADFPEDFLGAFEVKGAVAFKERLPDIPLGQDDEDIVEHRHLLEESYILECPRHAVERHLVASDSCQARRIGNDNFPAVDLVHAGEDIDERRLARTVRPDDARDFPLVKGNGKVVDGVHSVEVLDEVVGGKEGHGKGLHTHYSTTLQLCKQKTQPAEWAGLRCA